MVHTLKRKQKQFKHFRGWYPSFNGAGIRSQAVEANGSSVPFAVAGIKALCCNADHKEAKTFPELQQSLTRRFMHSLRADGKLRVVWMVSQDAWGRLVVKGCSLG